MELLLLTAAFVAGICAGMFIINCYSIHKKCEHKNTHTFIKPLGNGREKITTKCLSCCKLLNKETR